MIAVTRGLNGVARGIGATEREKEAGETGVRGTAIGREVTRNMTESEFAREIQTEIETGIGRGLVRRAKRQKGVGRETEIATKKKKSTCAGKRNGIEKVAGKTIVKGTIGEYHGLLSNWRKPVEKAGPHTMRWESLILPNFTFPCVI